MFKEAPGFRPGPVTKLTNTQTPNTLDSAGKAGLGILVYSVCQATCAAGCLVSGVVAPLCYAACQAGCAATGVAVATVTGRALHTSIYRVNVSTFCGICWVCVWFQRQTQLRLS